MKRTYSKLEIRTMHIASSRIMSASVEVSQYPITDPGQVGARGITNQITSTDLDLI